MDFRIGRSFTFHERYQLSFTADAFNLFNSTIVTGENTSAFSYLKPGDGLCTGHTNGCMLPTASFASLTTTSGALYGARQLQFGARLEF